MIRNIIITVLFLIGVIFWGVHVTECLPEHSKTVTTNEVRKANDPRGPRQFPMKMRLQKYNEQKGICPHCKQHFEFSQMQGDHIIPYSKGGCTVYENLQMLCAKCNHKKGNRYSY